MDFYWIATKKEKDGTLKCEVKFNTVPSRELMVRDKEFYAIYDERTGLWSRDRWLVLTMLDKAVREEAARIGAIPQNVHDFDSGVLTKLNRYCREVGQHWEQLDQDLVFADETTTAADLASFKLPYLLEGGDPEAWNRIMTTNYDEDNRRKIEWAIGCIIAGETMKIHKFFVFYGEPGTGKSTVLNVIEQLTDGYSGMVNADALVQAKDSFAAESLSQNPLAVFQHEADLSGAKENSLINAIVAHDKIEINAKYKSKFSMRPKGLLFLATNRPVKITDTRSGLMRRLIDIRPTGNTIKGGAYYRTTAQIPFELGRIAQQCLSVYKELGPGYYNSYRAFTMQEETNYVHDFMTENVMEFSSGPVAFQQIWRGYKEFMEEQGAQYRLTMSSLLHETKPYFKEYHEQKRIEGVRVRKVFEGLKREMFSPKAWEPIDMVALEMWDGPSELDVVLADMPAQYEILDEQTGQHRPEYKWENCNTKLSDLDTSRVHYVKVPEDLIVIDFDIRNENGEKDLAANLEAAALWPTTYAERSKSGGGVHLHYYYRGASDVSRLKRIHGPGIEVKVYRGGSALRRRYVDSNHAEVAEISTGLALRPMEAEVMLDKRQIRTEKGLRALIERNLRKEIHPGTKPSIDFIKHILDEAHRNGVVYDLTDLKKRLVVFAASSTHQAPLCIDMVQAMKFKSEDKEVELVQTGPDNRPEVFFDVEVFPNLVVVGWKYAGGTHVTMVNPKPHEIEKLCEQKLIGFNCRKYDNHILYALMLGWNNLSIYNLSKAIIDNKRDALFREAYRISYTDIYDFSSKKQGLKAFEVELGIVHSELGLPWDQDVADKDVPRVLEYNQHDLDATEAVWNARQADFKARQILAELSGLTVNDTTQRHTAQIVFEGDRYASKQFVYTDLSEMFPGYVYDSGKSVYRGEVVGEGGYVFAEPGYYEDVGLLDVASMHPTSIVELNLFGKYTPNFKDLLDARLAIKHKDLKTARKMLDGKLKPYLEDEEMADELAYALKIVINIVYGLTSARFENPFKDIRNKDNIVAKRGALFMIDLKHYIQDELGLTVAHIKTDSVKVPGLTESDAFKIVEFGKRYGYDFEYEAVYEKFLLFNDAVFVSRKSGRWEATGAQFLHPYVFKYFFGGEHLWEDHVETRQVKQGAIYTGTPDKEGPMQFVGRLERFVPVEAGGHALWRVKDGKAYALTGTRGYSWMQADQARSVRASLDQRYYDGLVGKARNSIEKFVSVETLLS